MTTSKNVTVNGINLSNNASSNLLKENVRYGEWQFSFADNGWADHTCSACGYTINTDVHVSVNYPVCPNCGAILDKSRAFFNPSRTIRERIIEYVSNVRPMEFMCIFNNYKMLCYNGHEHSGIYPMSMFNYIMKDALKKSYLDVAEAVSNGEFDSRNEYFYIDDDILMSGDKFIDGLVTEYEIDDLADYAIKHYEDFNDSHIRLYLEEMSGPDPQTMDWNTYTEMIKGEKA